MMTEYKRWTEEKGWQDMSPSGPGSRAQLVLLFGDRRILEKNDFWIQVRQWYPHAHIAGCSTSGEILGKEVTEDSLVMTAVYFEKTAVRAATVRLESMQDSFDAAVRLSGAFDKKGLRHLLVFSDGLTVNGSELAKGFVSALPEDVAVTGGLAGDKNLFQETIVVSDQGVTGRIAVAVGFYGDDLRIGYGSLGGWNSFGLDRVVTRSRGNVLYEIDGQPALELYKRYLGDQARELPAAGRQFPLSLCLTDNRQGRVRTVLAIDEREGSMIFSGNIPQGQHVRLMKANLKRLIEGAAGAARASRKISGVFRPDLALLISCVGRKLVLKQGVEEEVEEVCAELNEPASVTGFYSYGELCPAVTGNRCELHNQTMTVVTFAEEPCGEEV